MLDKKEIKDEFIWNVDYDLMIKLKNAKNGEDFKCDNFILNGFKWFLQIYPTGKNKKKMMVNLNYI